MNTASKAAAIIAIAAVILAALACGGSSAVAFEDESGLTYDLYQAGRTATVTGYDGNVEGNLEIPATVTYNGIEYRVTTIGESAFTNQDGMTSVTVPNSVTSIGASAFDGSGLSSADLSSATALKTIGDRAFYRCSDLGSVILPTSLVTIGDYAFCLTALTAVDFNTAGSLKTIGDYAFFGLDIAAVELPDSVTTLGEEAFGENMAVQEFTLPKSLSSYDASFAGCDSLTEFVKGTNTNFSVTSGVLFNSKGTELCQYPAGKEGSKYSIGSGVDEIAEKAFLGCHLVTVTIPSGVTDIGTGAFADCRELTTITVDSSNSKYSSESGVLFNKTNTKTKTILVCYPAGKDGETYQVPSTITTIQSMAFYGAGLSEVQLPDKLETIGSEAFRESSLSSEQLNQKLSSLGSGAFAGCESLKTVTIPSTVRTLESTFSNCTGLETVVWTGGTGSYTVGDYVFSGCSSLSSVSLPDGVKTIGCAAFEGCDSLSTLTFPSGLTTVEEHAFSGSGLTEAVIPEGVKTIGEGAFMGCPELASVSLPSTISEIPDAAFSSCPSLSDVRFADKVPKVWGDRAFESTGLTTMAIPEGVESIGFAAFSGCGSLAEVSVPASLADVGDQAFSSCPSLTGFSVSEDNTFYGTDDGVLVSKDRLTLVAYPAGSTVSEYYVPDGTVTIAQGAFNSAAHLTTVHIPGSVRTIGDHAFECCTGITQMTIESTDVTVGKGAFAFSEDPENPVSVEIFTDAEPFDESVFGDAVSVTYDAYKNYGMRSTGELMGDALIWVAVAIVLGVVFLAVAVAGRKG